MFDCGYWEGWEFRVVFVDVKGRKGVGIVRRRFELRDWFVVGVGRMGKVFM